MRVIKYPTTGIKQASISAVRFNFSLTFSDPTGYARWDSNKILEGSYFTELGDREERDYNRGALPTRKRTGKDE